jgi:ClpP class serine protease
MWLLESSVRHAMQNAERSGYTPTAEQMAKFEANIYRDDDEGGSATRLLRVVGNNAEISIRGVVTNTPSFMAMIFGGGNTTYPEINAAIAAAEQDDAVDNIAFMIESPGGNIAGLFDTIGAIQAAKKPTKAVISNMGASAAYAIACACDSIAATNIATSVGSIGVVVSVSTDENQVSITSTKAPRKRPDATTEEGVAMVREELDAYHEIFVDVIAEGRGTTTERVNAEFGQGGTILAREALKRGMIDSILAPGLKAVESTKPTTATSGKQPEATNMDLKTLQSQHPETFSAAVLQGVTEERDRVTSHLIAGELSGDTKTASASIKDGSIMTMTLQTQYMMATANRSDVNGRQEDDAGANAGDNANGSDEAEPGADVASIIEGKLGIGV